MRRRLTYANVTATLALVFAMSGGALAANHYLINSTKQINPKVLKKLTGKAGAPGATGATGATGAVGPAGAPGKEGSHGENGKDGKEGKEGEPGPLLKTLPSGATVYGTIGAEAQVNGVEVAANAQLPFPAPVALDNAHVLVAPKTQCKGSSENPTAEAGYVCIYPYYESDPATGFVWGSQKSKYGFQMSFNSTGVGDAVFANWAYTAP
jgi:hypothetical protein